MANIAKKLVRVWLLTLTIVLFSSISIYAEDNVQGDFFIKNIIVNGERIVNYNLQYSFVLYNDTMYVPLTPEIREIFDVSLEMDWESRTLKLQRVETTRRNISENWLKNDANPLFLNVVPDARVIAQERVRNSVGINVYEGAYEEAFITFEVDLGDMPLLEKDGHFFVPLRAIANNQIFNWDIHYDSFFGITVSTNSNVPAKAFFNYTEAMENRGLVRYMMRHNSTIGTSYGQQLVFLFRRAGEVNGISHRLLMALAHRESTFNNATVSRSGAIGIMQIMPSTGERFGVTPEQLFYPKVSIDFGAMYLRLRLEAFDGCVVSALSAYNQGARAVLEGRHSTTFAYRVIDTYNAITEFLQTYGYIAKPTPYYGEKATYY